MRVANYYNNLDVRTEEMPVPKIGPGELLVKVIAGGVCGSDVMEWYRIRSAPRVLGHEIAGEVVVVGEGVDRFALGDRVTVSHHVPCNTCEYCLAGNHTVCDTLRSTNFDPGGFAEYLRVPQINVDRGTFVLPDEVSFDEGTFIEPLACVLRGQRKAGLKPGQSVLVLGSGISGILHVQLARCLGAGRIMATDINDRRLSEAKRFGADATIKATENVAVRVRELNDGRLADMVIVCAGAAAAVQQAFESVERSGTILLFAPSKPDTIIPLPLWDLWQNCVTITHTYAGAPIDIKGAIDIIRHGNLKLDEMITHRLGLSEADRAFQLVAEAQDCLKVIIYPHK